MYEYGNGCESIQSCLAVKVCNAEAAVDRVCPHSEQESMALSLGVSDAFAMSSSDNHRTTNSRER